MGSEPLSLQHWLLERYDNAQSLAMIQRKKPNVYSENATYFKAALDELSRLSSELQAARTELEAQNSVPVYQAATIKELESSLQESKKQVESLQAAQDFCDVTHNPNAFEGIAMSEMERKYEEEIASLKRLVAERDAEIKSFKSDGVQLPQRLVDAIRAERQERIRTLEELLQNGIDICKNNGIALGFVERAEKALSPVEPAKELEPGRLPGDWTCVHCGNTVNGAKRTCCTSCGVGRIR